MGSRRYCESLIDDRRVSVDGKVIEEQGVQIDPSRQSVRLDGKRVRPETKRYLLLNKPRYVLCTANDPEGRPTYNDFLPDDLGRIYTVGRLDAASEGALIVTNDGHFAQSLAHPRHHITKTYTAWVDKPISRADEESFHKGIRDGDELLRALDVRRVKRGPEAICYKMVLGEGRNRQIRRMFESLDRKVKRLQRTHIGRLPLGKLPPGKWRHLKAQEVSALLKEAGRS